MEGRPRHGTGAADGRFVYAVTSTGIYCRPSCPSRRPRRDRVRFFDDVEAAERGGLPRVPPLPPAAGGGRSVDREDPARVRLPGQRGRPSVARDAGRARRRQPVSPAAQLQADRRRVAARVRRSLPAAQGEAAAAAGRARDRRDVRRGVRIEQPLLRAGRAQAGDVAVGLSAGRSWHEHPIHDRRFAARASAGGGHRARRLRGGDGRVARRARARARAGIPGGEPRRRRGRARALDERDPRAPRRAAAASSICRSTSRRRRSSGRCGRRSPRFRTARRDPTPRSPRPSDVRARRGRSRARARPIRSRSPFPATASSPRRAASAATGGASRGRRSCSPASGEPGPSKGLRERSMSIGSIRSTGRRSTRRSTRTGSHSSARC